MKRSAFLAAAATVLATGAGVPAAGSAERAARIGVLGDSLALGTGATNADGGFIFRAYRTILAQRPGSRIDSAAIGGATVADVLRLEVARFAHRPYDAIVVCVGGNDVVRGIAPELFERTYATLLQRIRATIPGAAVICCGVPDVSISPLFADEREAIARTSLLDDRAVRACAAADGAAFVDLYRVAHARRDPERFLGRDRFHPSDLGYTLLERALTPVLERALAGR